MNNDINLLYIEDDKETSNQYIKIFKKYFTKVITTSSASEALSILINKDILVDVLITDIQLDSIDGLELLKIIKDVYPNIKRIILTAYNQKNYINKAADISVESYWIKPVSNELINKNLTVLISKIQKIKNPILKEELYTIKINQIYKFNYKKLLLYKNDEIFRLPLRETTLINFLVLSNKEESFSLKDLVNMLYINNTKTEELALRGIINNLKFKLNISKEIVQNSDYNLILYNRQKKTYKLNFNTRD
jgi:DNA-binding response OmpR family regulator